LRGLSRGGLGGSRLGRGGVWRWRKSLGEPVRIRESDEN
jgi:hypothetical protein